MREIVVISGKGGTGKTSVCAALAHLASGGMTDAGKNIVICDLDVDAPDLHLLQRLQQVVLLLRRQRRRERLERGRHVRVVTPSLILLFPWMC